MSRTGLPWGEQGWGSGGSAWGKKSLPRCPLGCGHGPVSLRAAKQGSPHGRHGLMQTTAAFPAAPDVPRSLGAKRLWRAPRPPDKKEGFRSSSKGPLSVQQAWSSCVQCPASESPTAEERAGVTCSPMQANSVLRDLAASERRWHHPGGCQTPRFPEDNDWATH